MVSGGSAFANMQLRKYWWISTDARRWLSPAIGRNIFFKTRGVAPPPCREARSITRCRRDDVRNGNCLSLGMSKRMPKFGE
jgi:hypothetical protein